jgi:prevent-host-death family protein
MRFLVDNALSPILAHQLCAAGQDAVQGESFVITRHGRPVAQLIPIARHDPDKVRKAIEGLKQFARQHSLKGLKLKDLIAEGRR